MTQYSASTSTPRRPELLLASTIPKPLHGVNPRTIMGPAAWDILRKQVYAASGHRCVACGVRQAAEPNFGRLEAHEVYDINWAKARMWLSEIVALCVPCHLFIHHGQAIRMLVSREISTATFEYIMEHGGVVTKGLKHPVHRYYDNKRDWADWRLIWNGQEYGPSTSSFAEWKAKYKAIDDLPHVRRRVSPIPTRTRKASKNPPPPRLKSFTTMSAHEVYKPMQPNPNT
jgi:hypothetical protein